MTVLPLAPVLPLLGAVALAVQYARSRRRATRETVTDEHLGQFELADRIDAEQRLARKRRRRDRG